MNPQRTIPQRQKLAVIKVVLLTSFFALCVIGIVTGTAQSTEEREFKNTIPAHVPVKVKLKNEQAFKKMDNKDWARDLEIEVKNTGSKPIYYLYVIVSLPDVILRGYPVGFQVAYGRKELAFLETPLEPGDVPIRLGESITLKIPEGQARAYEQLRDEEERDDPKKVEFDLQIINFGDGTGLRSTQGNPDSIRKRSRNAPRPKGSLATAGPPRRHEERIHQANSSKLLTPQCPQASCGLIFPHQIMSRHMRWLRPSGTYAAARTATTACGDIETFQVARAMTTPNFRPSCLPAAALTLAVTAFEW